MSNWRAWVIVGRGLELKLASLVLFAGLPLLSALLWFSESDPRWLLLGVGLAAAPDFVGRCLCLAAPPQLRLSVILSVVFQVFAFVALAGFGYTDGVGEFGAGILVVVGILVAGGLQLASAVLFTRFLRTAGEVLGHPEVSDRADQLSWRLGCSLAASSGLGLAAFIVAAVVLVGVLTRGIFFYVSPQVAAIVLLPLVLLTVLVVVGMYWAYGSTMVRLRAAIRGMLPSAAPAPETGSDAEPGAAADGGA